MHKAIVSIGALALVGAWWHMSNARAEDDLLGWLENGSISGDERLYDFSRDYAGTASNLPAGSPYTGKTLFDFNDMNSFSFGGKLKAKTADWNGFSAALALYYGYDLGANNYTYNSSNLYAANYHYPYLNPLLMGINRTVNTIGEAWLQYRNQLVTLRGGREVVDNPWVNPSDGFMIPNLFEGESLQVTPTPTLTLSMDSINDYKNRTTVDFNQTTIDALPYDKLVDYGDTGRTLDAGASWKTEQAHLNAWLYDFNNIANMGYMEGGYRFPVAQQMFFANAQYVREAGKNPSTIGSVNADIYGFKLGIELPESGNVFFAYNVSANNPVSAVSATPVSVNSAPGMVYNGNFYSPYTQIYNTDPLFTTVMNYGLVSARAPGHAWMIGTTLHLMGNSLDILPTVSEYYTNPYVANVRAYLVDVSWHCSGRLKGLTLRDRLGVEHDVPLLGTAFVDNRVMLQYVF